MYSIFVLVGYTISLFLFQFWADQRGGVRSRARSALNAKARSNQRGHPMDLLRSYDREVIECLGGWHQFMGDDEMVDPMTVSHMAFNSKEYLCVRYVIV